MENQVLHTITSVSRLACPFVIAFGTEDFSMEHNRILVGYMSFEGSVIYRMYTNDITDDRITTQIRQDSIVEDSVSIK